MTERRDTMTPEEQERWLASLVKPPPPQARARGELRARLKAEREAQKKAAVAAQKGQQACKGGKAHHWLIDTPDGPVSKGKCKRCKTTREFQNWAPDAIAVYDPALQTMRAIRWTTRGDYVRGGE